ncbi:hypothetical protein EV424DRAFT_1265686, partial [Suillus variegatus]
NSAHLQKPSCGCTDCIEDTLQGCKNPHKCVTVAKSILDNLLPKFNPNTSPRKDNLTLTHRHLEKNVRARREQQGEITFNPSVTLKTDITDGFRIFVDPSRPINIPAYRLAPP